MRLALISNVHRNLPALGAVLDDIADDDVNATVCVGDVVGYRLWPTAYMERVREMCSVVVQGNHERNIPTPEAYSHNEMAMRGLEYANAELDYEQVE